MLFYYVCFVSDFEFKFWFWKTGHRVFTSVFCLQNSFGIFFINSSCLRWELKKIIMLYLPICLRCMCTNQTRWKSITPLDKNNNTHHAAVHNEIAPSSPPPKKLWRGEKATHNNTTTTHDILIGWKTYSSPSSSSLDRTWYFPSSLNLSFSSFSEH